jgi:CRP-like cAMP-binding protein
MFQIAAYENYQDGAVIFEDGSHGDWIYVVEEGEVEISKRIDEQKIVIEVLKPGEMFGELAYIGRMARTATAIAVGPTVVGLLDRDYFDREFNSLPANFQVMLKTVAVRLKNTTERILMLTSGRECPEPGGRKRG